MQIARNGVRASFRARGAGVPGPRSGRLRDGSSRAGKINRMAPAGRTGWGKGLATYTAKVEETDESFLVPEFS